MCDFGHFFEVLMEKSLPNDTSYLNENFYCPHRSYRIRSLNSAFTDSVDETFYFSGERHDFWEMVYVLEGNMIASEDDRVYDLSAGQAVFHAPLEFHRLWTPKEHGARFMIISFSVDGELPVSIGNGIYSFSTKQKHRLEECFDKLTTAFVCGGTVPPFGNKSLTQYHEQEALMSLELFLIYLAIESAPTETESNSRSAVLYKKVLNVLNEHIDSNLTVEDIARISVISSSNIKKLFREFAGCGVMEYYNKLRIVRACELLREGYSVLSVSSVMNYSSPNYFSVSFKREMHLSPSAYQKTF